MRNKRNLFLLTILGFIAVMISCNDAQPAKETEYYLQRNESHGIMPNPDAKYWQANEATTAGVHKMLDILDDFDLNSTSVEYNELYQKLENEMIIIFSKCNMEGEAHNQLHNFLLPAYDHIKIFKDGELNACRENYKALKRQLGIYPIYFN